MIIKSVLRLWILKVINFLLIYSAKQKIRKKKLRNAETNMFHNIFILYLSTILDLSIIFKSLLSKSDSCEQNIL